MFGVLLSNNEDKPMITVFATDDLMESINCSQIVRDLAKHIQGGGGGQPFFATAGGKLSEGLAAAEAAAAEEQPGAPEIDAEEDDGTWALGGTWEPASDASIGLA